MFGENLHHIMFLCFSSFYLLSCFVFLSELLPLSICLVFAFVFSPTPMWPLEASVGPKWLCGSDFCVRMFHAMSAVLCFV